MGGGCLGINQTDRRQTGKGTARTEPGGGWTGTRPVRSSEPVRATKVRNGREQAWGPRAGASTEAAGEPWTVRSAADRNRWEQTPGTEKVVIQAEECYPQRLAVFLLTSMIKVFINKLYKSA
ncbi:hypothetical protein SKAU_G00032600 [Synaphobranchus kaupii]|uniref:Uncharacterized protein n=1 Tax=Synaphobranchus kaupii TaxID=118154 RepID=A0A9Q1JG41_SYNKA|nr:hypothetical protein SKAU_G00032600 [Synaphobranchus kaupii]